MSIHKQSKISNTCSGAREYTSALHEWTNELVNGKATGIHNIPHKVLKDSVHLVAPVLMDIFNLSISTKIFPDDLKVLKVNLQ